MLDAGLGIGNVGTAQVNAEFDEYIRLLLLVGGWD